MENEPAYVDGNAAAGVFSEVFALEVTAAVGICSGCGATGPIAQAHVYLRAPGMVVRCAHCEQPLMRLVKAPGRMWIDLRGLVSLELSLPETDG